MSEVWIQPIKKKYSTAYRPLSENHNITQYQSKIKNPAVYFTRNRDHQECLIQIEYTVYIGQI